MPTLRSLLPTVLPIVLSIVPLTAPSLAQEGSRRPDDPTRERARIVRLEDGRVLRGRARLDADAWVVEGVGRVPASVVRDARAESDVLREAKKLEARLRPTDVGRRVELAAWMLAEGLVPEALRHLDKVLDKEPDQPRALAILDDVPPARLAGAPPRGAPVDAEARATLRELGTRAKPAMRELVVRRLGDAESEALLLELELDLHDKKAGRRALATVALRRLFPGRATDGLIARSIFDRDSDVRRGAALGLAAMESPPIDAHLRALESEVTAVRTNAAESLGWIGQAAAVPALVGHLAAVQSGATLKPPRANIFIGREIAYVMDYDVEIAQGASIADPVIGTIAEGSVLDARAYGANIDRTVVLEVRALTTSLERITGERPGRRASSWIQWYEKNRERWEPPASR